MQSNVNKLNLAKSVMRGPPVEYLPEDGVDFSVIVSVDRKIENNRKASVGHTRQADRGGRKAISGLKPSVSIPSAIKPVHIHPSKIKYTRKEEPSVRTHLLEIDMLINLNKLIWVRINCPCKLFIHTCHRQWDWLVGHRL